MIRYSDITNKNQREIVLLKASPCAWGKCTFCDYIEDNNSDTQFNVNFNKEILKNVTGKHNVLEVINSGSCFELPKETLDDIKNVLDSKGIKKLFFESHWIYRNRLEEMKQFFNIPIIFKCGIETFDNHFRCEVLKKGAVFSGPEEVSKYFNSICLMVGIKGQTKAMIKTDIEYLLKYFKHGCINIYVENSTPFKRDEELISWFRDNYSFLEENDNIEILWNNTDFGVGGN
ncbi:radical SAM protein [Clostridium sp. JS66]|uniref:radical SAM protein n=1 Tax=Clostridium sp. JS66 TaxID=3064705 RepID=UPI00298DCAE1|nr:radical SAM protein [Clostridium sp. JS66]WPC43159.1 radical SAM protein [Clostridium sp. JS66]